MRRPRFCAIGRRAAAVGAALLVLPILGCGGEPERKGSKATGREASGRESNEKRSEGSAPVTAVDREGSWVVAVTDKSGALGFLGHRHAILATDWRAEVDWRPEAPSESRARFTVPAASLRIDSDGALKLAGLDKGPDADTVKKLQAKLLDAQHLAAAEHPELAFETAAVERSGEKRLTVEGKLTIRGQTRAVRFPVEVSQERGTARFSGGFTVRHTDFGIEPESVAGVVNVADPVEIRFQVTLRQ